MSRTPLYKTSDIVAAWRALGSIAEAAIAIGCTKPTVYAHLRKAGLIPPKLQAGPKPDERLNKQLWKEFIAGSPLPIIAVRYGFQTQTLRGRLMGHGRRLAKAKKRPIPRTLAEARELGRAYL